MTLRAPDGTELADDEKLPTYRSITNGSVLEMEVRSLLLWTPCLPCCCGLLPACLAYLGPTASCCYA